MEQQQKKVVFVIKEVDSVSLKTEYLFIDKQDYFVNSVTEDELIRKSYELAVNKFLKKQNSKDNSKVEYQFIINTPV